MFQTITLLALVSSITIVSADNIYCSSLTYKGVYSSFDGWCQSSCNQFSGSFPGYCPEEFCVCGGEEEVASSDYCESPRVCSSGEYVANPGTTASDGWCNSSCNSDPANCPCSMCVCAGGCGAGQTEVTLGFDDLSGSIDSLPSGYMGFSWANAAYLDATIYAGGAPTGYKNGLVSPNNVMFSSFGSDIVMTHSEFRVLSGHFNAAWQYNLTVSVEGKKGGVSVFSLVMDLDADVPPLFTEFPSLDIDELTLSSSSGIEDPDYPTGSGKHFLVDDLTVCVPTESLEKRSYTSRDSEHGVESDGPM